MSIDFVSQLDQRAAAQLAGELGQQLNSIATGHAPKVAIVACADARVVPDLLFGLEPNEALVVRSAGNQALPGGGQFSTLLLGINGCGIEDIIILGHSNCAAMHCLFDREFGAPHGELINYLLCCDPSLDSAVAEAENVEALAEQNVRNQMTIMRNALAERDLAHVRVHGRFLDKVHGELRSVVV